MNNKPDERLKKLETTPLVIKDGYADGGQVKGLEENVTVTLTQTLPDNPTTEDIVKALCFFSFHRGNWQKVIMPEELKPWIEIIEAECIKRERAAKREVLEKAKEREWEPFNEPESDEERGFNKGLKAQIGLTNKRIDELLTTITETGEEG